MKKFLVTLLTLGLAAGARAAVPTDLTGLKAADLKASAASESISVVPVAFEYPGSADQKMLCPAGAMLPGCPSFCAVYPEDPSCEAAGRKMLCPPGSMLPGCPSFCAVYPNDPSCEASGVKMLCPAGALIPGCPAYCAVYPSDPSCEGSDRKMLCPAGAMLPGCPSFCAVYPDDPSCEGSGLKMLCPPGAQIPGCPSFCLVYPDDPSCEAAGRKSLKKPLPVSGERAAELRDALVSAGASVSCGAGKCGTYAENAVCSSTEKSGGTRDFKCSMKAPDGTGALVLKPSDGKTAEKLLAALAGAVGGQCGTDGKCVAAAREAVCSGVPGNFNCSVTPY